MDAHFRNRRCEENIFLYCYFIHFYEQFKETDPQREAQIMWHDLFSSSIQNLKKIQKKNI